MWCDFVYIAQWYTCFCIYVYMTLNMCNMTDCGLGVSNTQCNLKQANMCMSMNVHVLLNIMFHNLVKGLYWLANSCFKSGNQILFTRIDIATWSQFGYKIRVLESFYINVRLRGCCSFQDQSVETSSVNAGRLLNVFFRTSQWRPLEWMLEDCKMSLRTSQWRPLVWMLWSTWMTVTS